MKAWILDQPGQPLALRDAAPPEARPGTAVVRMEAVPLLSYTRAYLNGHLPYAYPPGPFTPGTNGIGTITAVGAGVHHFRPGQRVALNPYWISDEAVAEPAQVLLGLTGISTDSAGMLAAFPHGTLRELADVPASTLIPLDGLEHLSAERLATLSKFAIPFGGLRRGRLAPGETVAINGAAGSFGAAAVLDALALGAARVVAIGRRAEPLQTLARLGHGRVVTVVLSGDVQADAAAIREAAGGGVDLAFDMVGRAQDPNSTLATLRSLRRSGRLVLMGSMQSELPITYGEMLINNWELIGHFMYTRADYLALVSLIRAGLLSLDAVEVRRYACAELEQAIDHAGEMEGLQSTVVVFEG
jgi:alcohol dehydrogenase